MTPIALAAAFVTALPWTSLQPAQTDVFVPGNDVTTPSVVREVKPSYPVETMTVGIEGGVLLDCVVNTDGSTSDVRVLQSLYPTLDEAAVAALQQWVFKPGVRNGAPVRVRVEVEMTFTLTRRNPALDSPEVFKPGGDVMGPLVLSEVKPEYSARAKAAGIQGVVRMDCVVLPAGTVGHIRVTKWLHPDLDLAAVQALRKWRFAPGTREGRAVPVQVFVEMTFAVK